MKNEDIEFHPASFRDPHGFLFSQNAVLYRQVNHSFAEQFDEFIDSGLYDELVKREYIVSHRDVTKSVKAATSDGYRVLAPELVGYISYPYEWSFGQLRDAAILTLRVQMYALNHGFTLKDASAYNVQYKNGKPIFIDTLSFQRYEEGEPWLGYRQFCQHFLAPLVLMANRDISLSKLLAVHIDGVPLKLASKLLPARTWFKYSTFTHIHMHAKLQNAYADSSLDTKSTKAKARISSSKLKALIHSLIEAVSSVEWKKETSEWGDYYQKTNYDDIATKSKKLLIEAMLEQIPQPIKLLQDLGANSGEFSRIAAKYSLQVISQDIDPVAVEKNYCQLLHDEKKNLLPLCQDLFAPAPAIGWANKERKSFAQRGHCDVILALDLVHHLAITNNTPLSKIAEFFHEFGNWLIIEFIPKDDSQVKRLLLSRDDIFSSYDEANFEEAFSSYFHIKKKVAIRDSYRTLYLMQKKMHSETDF